MAKHEVEVEGTDYYWTYDIRKVDWINVAVYQRRKQWWRPDHDVACDTLCRKKTESTPEFVSRAQAFVRKTLKDVEEVRKMREAMKDPSYEYIEPLKGMGQGKP